MFNIENLLLKQKIEYRKSGSNVGRGEIGICCLFCGENRYHLSISLTKGVFGCWVCGVKGNLPKLISKLLGISYIEAKEIISPTSELKKILEERNKIVEEPIIIPNKDFKLPLHTYRFRKDKIDLWQETALQFLRDKYSLSWEDITLADLCYNVYGRYKNSIIIPFYLSGKMVNFISRSWDKNVKKRYDNCPNELSLVNVKKMVYNYDNVIGRQQIIIVEGCFDAIKTGLERTVALCGTEISQDQKNILIGLKAKEIIILFDNDPHLKTTSKKAQDLSDYLSPFCKTRVIKLPHGKDPGDMSREEIDNLLNDML